MTEKQTVQDQIVAARTALETVRLAHPTPRLFAAHRDAIRLALTQASLLAEGEIQQRIERVLVSAEAYEATGMFAFVPNWDYLFGRLDQAEAPAAGALVS